MIFGIGTDIVEINRIHRAIEGSERFAARILTEFELAEYKECKHRDRYLAKKFAAKEAFVKAMGTGIGRGFGWQMMQVEHTDLGKPYIVCFGSVKEFLDQHKVNNIHLSISDEQSFATAMVVLEEK